MVRTFSLAALAAAAFALPAAAEIEIHDPIAVVAYPGAPTGAAYLTIHNHGGPDDRLLSARADIAQRTELHATETAADGTMAMVEQSDGLPLPTDGEVVFRPGGLHVMMLGLSAGEEVALTLVFETAGEVAVTVPFGTRKEAMDLHGTPMEGMDHGAMDHGAADGAADAADGD
ncbi:copper chaperone PCu(A)C [Wenxinia marina]|uniref:Copper chaperone PCu(A)C n=1 Tax=Wenxinia marina DSM 24838 TaxID=1123501 RepID=A0A0D0Q6X2_9RHOB|nr:copper chaperone PCu(A)C [Wenxinia marina]KIQ70159.1 hypothetical protein Wenmar_01116 [Wenxinia marina DSM 24838]GGL50975.1 hypothetical protein GCM10011392_01400 [Wenxinia marina]